MRDNKHNDPRQRQNSPNDGSGFAGLTTSSLNTYTALQLGWLESIGAKFGESVPAPVLIRTPSNISPLAIVLTRWLAGGVFGVVFPVGKGEFKTGYVSLTDALRTNPGLTPSGTFSAEPWYEDPDKLIRHLLPQAENLKMRSAEVGRAAAEEILEKLPNIAHLTASSDLSDEGKALAVNICKRFAKPLVTEISVGLKIRGILGQEHANIIDAMAGVQEEVISGLVLLEALAVIGNEQASKKGAQFSMESLVDDAAGITSLLLEGLITRVMSKGPFSPPPKAELEETARYGINVSLKREKMYRQLWEGLSPAEKQHCMTRIEQLAWQAALKDRTSRN